MLTAKKVLAAARVYTQETAQEMGALKGAPCTIKSIVKSGNLNTVTFEWTDRSEVTHESTMLVYDGAPGTPGQDGDDGFSPTIVVKSSTSTEYILTITDKNGSYDTPNLKGSGGSGGASAMSDLTDVDLTALANGSVLVYDSTSAKWEATALSLSDISGIDLTGITDGQILAWDAANSKFVPADNTGEEYSAGMGIDISAQNEISTEFIMFPGTKAEWDLLPTSEKIKYTHTAWDDSQSGIVDNAPTENSDHLVTSGGVFTALSSKANTSDLGTAAAKDSTNAVTEGSTDLVESGAVYTALSAKADTADLGTAAAKDSTNAVTQSSTDLVESGAVYTAIGSAIADLDVSDSAVAGSYVTAVSETDGSISVTREAADVTPTANSTKMLTSGGAYTALGDKADKVTSATNGDFAGLDASGNLTDSGKKASDFATAQGLENEISTRAQLGAHNLNIYPYKNGKAGDVWSTNGIDFTVNSDGSITANGTATADAYFRCGISTDDTNPIHLVSGKKYILSGSGQANVSVRLRNSSNTGVANATTSEAVYECSSTGSYYILLEVPNGITVDNLTIYPMLRLATDSDSTYEPYAKSNQVITEDFQTMYKNNGILGVKNLLPTPYYSTKGCTTTSGTLTVTENADGSVTIDGTASGQSYIDLARNDKFLKAGTYILSGGITSKQYVYINCLNNGTYVKTLASAITSEVKFVLDYNGYDAITVGISIASGESLSNVTFYPMIRLASDTDTTYQPYAKTNRELTVDNADWDDMSNIGSVNTLDNIAQTTESSTSGLTATVNNDKTITVAPTSGTYPYTLPQRLIVDLTKAKPDFAFFPCKLSGCPSGGSLNAGTGYQIYYANYVDTDGMKVDAGDGVIITEEFNRTTYPNARIMMRINAGVTLEGPLTFKPMLTPVDYNGPYVPYAMTNRQFSAYESGKITYSIQATETAMTTIIKVGKVVQCNMMAAIGENVSAWTTFATIPEGFRPAFYVQAVNNKTMYTGFNIIQISPQGTVQSATALASGERLRFTAVWILP